MTEKMIIDAYIRIRTIDHTIPDDVLDFMKNAAIERLREENNTTGFPKFGTKEFNDIAEQYFSGKNHNAEVKENKVIRHGSDMITEEYVYKNDFRFQRMQKYGNWHVTYNNFIITHGQYRNDLEEWIDINYNR